MTLELAKWVGPDGHVVGLDRDRIKLEMARESARASHIENIKFLELSLSDWSESEAYDLVYSRFLLQHLASPAGALSRMWKAVRPGGALAVEDMDHDGWSSVPQNSGVEFLRDGLKTAIGAYGGDPSVGRRLVELFREAGIPSPEGRKLGRGAFAPDTKVLAPLTLESIQDSLENLNKGMAARCAAALKELNEFVADPRSLIHGPTLYQVLSRKALDTS